MKPDYATLIDAEVWDFIRRSEAYYPPDAIGLSVPGQRAVYDRMCAAFYRGRPPGVSVRDGVIAGVGVRHYHGAGVRVLYLHGGGFVLGGLGSHDDICAEICAGTGYRVIAADYPLAPEHLHPVAYHAVLQVAQALLAEGGPLIIVGDSAGGTLAASVALALRGKLAGLVLIYAGLGSDLAAGSALIHADAPLLTRADVLYFRDIRAQPGQSLAQDETASPLAATDYRGLPPVLAFSAECDPLCDDGRIWVERVQAAGGRGRFVSEAGLVHGYLRARHMSARAGTSFARIVAGIAALGRGQEP